MFLGYRSIISKRGSLPLFAIHKIASCYPDDLWRRSKIDRRAGANLGALHDWAQYPRHHGKSPAHLLRELSRNRAGMNTVDRNARAVETPCQFVGKKHIPELRQYIGRKLTVRPFALQVSMKSGPRRNR